ncbi:MAG TPA: ribosome silencing factor [Spirochaetia bacterium]|nr:ribosome silencing factor [Spirochaetia bacterium]
MDATSSSRQAAVEAARLLSEHLAEDTVVLDISGISSFADYFVIGTVRSSAHLEGLHRELEAFLKAAGIPARGGGRKSRGESGWLLLDCGELVIHLMEREQREFYDLERLWFKAERITYWSKSS